MIWRELVYRPVGILPSLLNFESSSFNWQGGSIHYPGEKHRWSHYAYQWDEGRETLFSNCISPSSKCKGDVGIHWISKSTTEQKQSIAYGARELPATIDKETGIVTEHLIYQRQNAPTKFLHRKHLVITGIRGISVMRTCKTFNQEVAEVLYGENLIIFDTRAFAESSWSASDEAIKQFELTRHRIPGIPDHCGRVPSNRQNVRAIQRMFDRKDSFPESLRGNLFTYFLQKIGPLNASLLTKFKFEGHFRTPLPNYKDDRPTEFAQLLPVYLVILQNVCGNLREVTLHVGRSTYDSWLNSTFDIKGPSNKTNEEKVDDAISRSR